MPVKHSLGDRLIKVVFICYCVVATGVTIIHIVQEYRFTKKSIQFELQSYQGIFDQVIAKPMWNLDLVAMESVLNAIIEVPIIDGVTIMDKNQGNIFAAIGMVVNKDGSVSLKQEDSSMIAIDKSHNEFSQYQFPLIYQYQDQDYELGVVTFHSSNDNVVDRVKVGFTFLVVNAFLKGLALWLIINWFIKRLFIYPLRHFKDEIFQLHNKEKTSQDLKSDPQYQLELKELRDEFIFLNQSLEENEKKLINFNETLTKAVDERTFQLKQERDKAEKVMEAKSKFLSVMSHEIRTPMNGVIANLERISADDIKEASKIKNLKNAKISSHALMEIVNNVLDFSKLDAQQVELDIYAIKLHDFLVGLLSVYQEQFKTKNVDLILDDQFDSTLLVRADMGKVGQIINNLVSNALKFTDKGRVSVIVKVKSLDTEHRLIIEVSDTGIGIAKEKQADVFQSFSQAEVFTTRQYGGTGLGLAIVKQLCELLHGHISLQSDLNKGTNFTVSIPIELVEDVAEVDDGLSELAKFEHKKILVVEDNLINQEVAKDILEDFGCEIMLANNGKEAIDVINQNQFDLVLMDCQMPLMDGYTATEIIKKEQLSSAPVIALTANASKEDKEKCMYSGMDDFLTKPIDIQQLNQLMVKYLIS